MLFQVKRVAEVILNFHIARFRPAVRLILYAL